MKIITTAFFGFIIPMLLLDSIWLTTMVKTFYAKYIGQLFAPTPSIAPAIIFYLLYTVGVLVFVVFPALSGNYSLVKVFTYGALFGLVAYATYDLTNQATLKIWSTIITIVDLMWGAFITGTASTIAVWVSRLWK